MFVLWFVTPMASPQLYYFPPCSPFSIAKQDKRGCCRCPGNKLKGRDELAIFLVLPSNQDFLKLLIRI